MPINVPLKTIPRAASTYYARRDGNDAAATCPSNIIVTSWNGQAEVRLRLSRLQDSARYASAKLSFHASFGLVQCDAKCNPPAPPPTSSEIGAPLARAVTA